MRLSGFETFIKSSGIRPAAWALIVLAVMVSGCAVSQNSTSSNHIAGASASGQPVLAEGENGTAATEDSDEWSADDEFDLLEEELIEQTVVVPDPLEPVNRVMYFVNDVLFVWVLNPCARGWSYVVPEPARIGVRNFFYNLHTPVRLVNCALQGKGEAAGTEFKRFVINTTIGVLGIGDPAREKYGLELVDEDLGQTLAVHGLGDGFYIMLPVLGPSTLRDSVGKVGDLFLNPVYYLASTEVAVGIWVVRKTNEVSFHTGEYEAFKAEAVEPYVAMRQAYIQYRKRQIEEGVGGDWWFAQRDK
jgi:phospholipid-binding lipoprotein MlaA